MYQSGWSIPDHVEGVIGLRYRFVHSFFEFSLTKVGVDFVKRGVCIFIIKISRRYVNLNWRLINCA